MSKTDDRSRYIRTLKRNARKRKGVCTECGQPLAEKSKRLCERHLTASLKHKADWKVRNPDYRYTRYPPQADYDRAYYLKNRERIKARIKAYKLKKKQERLDAKRASQASTVDSYQH